MYRFIILILSFTSCTSNNMSESQPIIETPFVLWKCYYDFPINGNPEWLIFNFQNLQYGQRSMVNQTIYSNGVATESQLDVMITESGIQFYTNNSIVRYLTGGPYMKLYLTEAGVNAADVTCVKNFN